MSKLLRNQKILLLAPSFFQYEEAIKNELENMGADVYLYDERPDNDFVTKFFIRLNFKFVIKKDIKKYYDDIIEKTKRANFDCLFLIAPETINREVIKKIKHYHPKVKVYVYMWDSLKNKKNAKAIIDIVDKFFSFDPDDALANNVQFLPLFYKKSYQDIANKHPVSFMYDICFIGTIHSDRYRVIKNVELFAKNNNLNTYFYFYSPSKILFVFQRIFKKEFRGISLEDVSFTPLSENQINSVIQNSKVVVDIEHLKQKGLTMRTIEMLGAKKKLITTNENIKNYDFFNENNVHIIKRDDIVISLDFFDSDFKVTGAYENYSIRAWIEKIFI